MHGHPRPGYDCLIELHEVNWRRRRLLLDRVPHMLLIDHCTIGLWLPLLSPFDVHLYERVYAISTLDGYWNFYGMIKSTKLTATCGRAAWDALGLQPLGPTPSTC